MTDIAVPSITLVTPTTADSVLGVQGGVVKRLDLALWPVSTPMTTALADKASQTGANTFAQGTITTSQPQTFTQTWNNPAIAFNQRNNNVIDNGSAAGSTLETWQLNSVTKIKFSKQGYVQAIAGLFGTMDAAAFRANSNGACISTAAIYGFGNGSNVEGGGSDGGWCRKSAGVGAFTDGLWLSASGNIRGLVGGGAAVASAAALPIPTGRVFHVTGTTNITSITSTGHTAGVVITIIFDGVLTLTDGGNLKLAGNFVTAADSTITLAFDGTNWYECSRSSN